MNDGWDEIKSEATLHQKAIELVRDEYKAVDRVSRLTLEQANRRLEAEVAFTSKNQFLKHWLPRAESIASFAVNIGSISPDEALEAILEFQRVHPDTQASNAPPRQAAPSERNDQDSTWQVS